MKKNYTLYQPGSLPVLPLYNSSVKAGFPSPADDFIDKRLDLNDYLIKHPSATFFFTVGGNAMKNAGIYAGDTLIVDRSLDPYQNCIIVAVIEGNFLVRRYTRSTTGVILFPENDHEQPISITSDIDFTVWGVVTTVIHKVVHSVTYKSSTRQE